MAEYPHGLFFNGVWMLNRRAHVTAAMSVQGPLHGASICWETEEVIFCTLSKSILPRLLSKDKLLTFFCRVGSDGRIHGVVRGMFGISVSHRSTAQFIHFLGVNAALAAPL
jgi:hypothetical protein